MTTEEQLKKDEYFMRRALDEAEAAYREARNSRRGSGRVSRANHCPCAQSYRDTQRCYGTCRDAGHYHCRQRIGRKVPSKTARSM